MIQFPVSLKLFPHNIVAQALHISYLIASLDPLMMILRKKLLDNPGDPARNNTTLHIGLALALR